MRVRVGIVDSGVSPAQAAALVASVRLVPDDGAGARRVPPLADAMGHGTAVAAIVLAQAPLAQLASAQAFTGARHADAACVAEGIAWCLEQDARVINLSLGLRADHAALRLVCRTAVATGALVVAASPARGGSVYPAAYPGVIAVCGDARCATHTWSIVEPERLYGASTLAGDGVTPGGASYAAARLSACAAGFLAAWPECGAADFQQWLKAGAAFRGREQHQAAEFA
jgi:subtilisin family serine protease